MSPIFPSFFQDYQVILFDEQDPALFPYNIRISNAVLKYYPEDIPSISNLGVIAYYQEDLEGATVHFQRAVDLDPSDMIVVFNLAYMYESLGDVEKAIATYELALASEDPEARDQAKAIIAELKDVAYFTHEQKHLFQLLQRPSAIAISQEEKQAFEREHDCHWGEDWSEYDDWRGVITCSRKS